MAGDINMRWIVGTITFLIFIYTNCYIPFLPFIHNRAVIQHENFLAYLVCNSSVQPKNTQNDKIPYQKICNSNYAEQKDIIGSPATYYCYYDETGKLIGAAFENAIQYALFDENRKLLKEGKIND